MKVKKNTTVLAMDLVVDDELRGWGTVVFKTPTSYGDVQLAYLDEDGLLLTTDFGEKYPVDIVREVEKPDIVRVGTNTGDTMVIQDFDDGNVSISIFDRMDRAVYGAPFVSANELIDAIKTVKGLD